MAIPKQGGVRPVQRRAAHCHPGAGRCKAGVLRAPKDNAGGAAVVQGLQVVPIQNLREGDRSPKAKSKLHLIRSLDRHCGS